MTAKDVQPLSGIIVEGSDVSTMNLVLKLTNQFHLLYSLLITF
jgi:hypothetical protein